jgi:hypothetical protein
MQNVNNDSMEKMVCQQCSEAYVQNFQDDCYSTMLVSISITSEEHST